MIYIRKCVRSFGWEREDWRFDPGIAGKQIRVGIPMGLQYSITAIGTMMVQSSLNMLGSGAVAAFTAGSKIDNVFTQAFVALGTTMSTYNAQNIGARQLERVRKGFPFGRCDRLYLCSGSGLYSVFCRKVFCISVYLR